MSKRKGGFTHVLNNMARMCGYAITGPSRLVLISSFKDTYIPLVISKNTEQILSILGFQSFQVDLDKAESDSVEMARWILQSDRFDCFWLLRVLHSQEEVDKDVFLSEVYEILIDSKVRSMVNPTYLNLENPVADWSRNFEYESKIGCLSDQDIDRICMDASVKRSLSGR